MATQRQRQAAKRNVKKRIAHLPKKTRSALGRDELERALARR